MPEKGGGKRRRRRRAEEEAAWARECVADKEGVPSVVIGSKRMRPDSCG